MKAKSNAASKKAESHSGCVCLRLTHPTAEQVFVAGSFNDWQPTVTPLTRGDEGTWITELMLPPGRYEYRFVIDGQWADDPNATELIPNPFGTANAVLVIEMSEPAIAHSARSTPTPNRRASARNNTQTQACCAPAQT